MAVNLDAAVLPLADALLACFCPLLEQTTGGMPECGCCLLPGPAVADVEHAWVRVSRIYPSGSRFPLQAADIARCALNEWGVELELGVFRCVSVLDDEGRPPSCDQLRRDAEVIGDDAAAMRQALLCCFADGRDVVVGAWEPYEPSGGMAGGRMTVTVRVEDCCPPNPPPGP